MYCCCSCCCCYYYYCTHTHTHNLKQILFVAWERWQHWLVAPVLCCPIKITFFTNSSVLTHTQLAGKLADETALFWLDGKKKREKMTIIFLLKTRSMIDFTIAKQFASPSLSFLFHAFYVLSLSLYLSLSGIQLLFFSLCNSCDRWSIQRVPDKATAATVWKKSASANFCPRQTWLTVFFTPVIYAKMAAYRYPP